MQQTLVIIKPDAMKAGLQDKIKERFRAAGFKIISSKTILLDRSLAEKHYAEHKGKPFFDGLVRFICSMPAEIMVIEGKSVIERMRALVGDTDPDKAEPGTIRADFKIEPVRNAEGIIQNLVHASDSAASAKREIELFFGK